MHTMTVTMEMYLLRLKRLEDKGTKTLIVTVDKARVLDVGRLENGFQVLPMRINGEKVCLLEGSPHWWNEMHRH